MPHCWKSHVTAHLMPFHFMREKCNVMTMDETCIPVEYRCDMTFSYCVGDENELYGGLINIEKKLTSPQGVRRNRYKASVCVLGG